MRLQTPYPVCWLEPPHLEQVLERVLAEPGEVTASFPCPRVQPAEVLSAYLAMQQICVWVRDVRRPETAWVALLLALPHLQGPPLPYNEVVNMLETVKELPLTACRFLCNLLETLDLQQHDSTRTAQQQKKAAGLRHCWETTDLPQSVEALSRELQRPEITYMGHYQFIALLLDSRARANLVSDLATPPPSAELLPQEVSTP